MPWAAGRSILQPGGRTRHGGWCQCDAPFARPGASRIHALASRREREHREIAVMTCLKALLAALCLAPAQSASVPPDGRLKKIYDTKAINVAYRSDALPFSFEDSDKKPSGYMVELCRSVITVIERQLGAGPLKVTWLPVTAQNRFTTV